MSTIKLENEKLILRKFEVDDYNDMFNNWASNKNVASRSGFPVHTDINSTKELIEYWVSEYNSENVFNWIIVSKETNEAIGSITIVNQDLNNRVCELGYSLGEGFWNNGYMTSAVKLVVDYIFGLDLFDTITANCHEYNIGSARVLEKNNFVKEGVLRNRKIIDGKKINLIQYSILKEDK